MALSQLPANARVLSGLRSGLEDAHPSVRDACVAALETLEGKEQKQPPAAKAPGAKYYVQVLEPSTKTTMSPVVLKAMHRHVAQLLSQVRGVRLAPNDEGQAAADAVISRDALLGFSIESVVNSVEKRGEFIRVSVAVVVATYPGRAIRAMLTGAASVSGSGAGEAAQRQAAEFAFASAMKQVTQVFDASRLQASAAPVGSRPARARRRAD